MGKKIKLTTPIKSKGEEIKEIELKRMVTAGDFIDADLPGRTGSAVDGYLLELVTGISYEDLRNMNAQDFLLIREEMASFVPAVGS